MSGVSGFLLQELSDARKIVAEEISKPGVRFLALSQRKASEELTEMNIVDAAPDNSVIQYRRGFEASIVCFGHSLAHGKSLVNLCDEKGKSASLFSVNYVEDAKWESAVYDASRTKRLVIIDDTFSTTSLTFRFLTDVLEFDPEVRFTVVRSRVKKSTAVSNERFGVDCEEVITWMIS
jgi:pyruvate/2-oxoglutarate/acetoin dehydrogenase E1 component